MARDDLLSVNDVARMWGTGLTVVVELVATSQLLSIDRGLLVSEGRYDVPLIRRSWAEGLQQGSEGAERTLPPPRGATVHPAVEVAVDFRAALEKQDAEAVLSLSSAASRAGRTPRDLLKAWQAAGGHLTQPRAGIGSTIYSLAPLDAVAARVVADAPALPRAVKKPTPVSLIDAVPFVLNNGEWRVDLPLFQRRDEWIHLLTSPLPEPSADDSGAASGTSGT